MPTDYGTDFSCVTDLDSALSTVSGPMVVVEAVLRRLQTTAGGLWYDRDYGTDVRQFLNGSRSRFAVSAAVEAEALKDERIEEAAAEVTFTDETLTIVLRLVLADAEFSLTIGVSQLTVDLISFNEAA